MPKWLLQLVLASSLEVSGLGKGVDIVAVPKIRSVVMVVVLRKGSKAFRDGRGVVSEAGGCLRDA